MISDPVHLGVAGLGRGFMLTLPSLRVDPHVRLVACAAPREESREAFIAEFAGAGFKTVEALAASPDVEAIYIATPHQMHRDHAIIAAQAGKHLLSEEPLALSMEAADALVAVPAPARRHSLTGPRRASAPPRP